MKNFICFLVVVLFGCSPDKPTTTEEFPDATTSAVEANQKDVTKGIGAVKEVTLNTPLEQDRVKRGLAIYEMKCSACHKLTDMRVVGPGWKGVTSRRKPEWIMKGRHASLLRSLNLENPNPDEFEGWETLIHFDEKGKIIQKWRNVK